MIDSCQACLSLLPTLKIVISHMFIKYITLLKMVNNINLVKLMNGKEYNNERIRSGK